MSGISSHFTRTYTTYSGVDITAIFDNVSLMTLSGIAISVTREKAPVYTMGSANPRSISRNKRGTAGSMMFTLFDRDAFYGLFLSEDHKYYAHADEINWLTNPINAAMNVGMYYNENDFNSSANTGGAGSTIDSLGRTAGSDNFGIDYPDLDANGSPLPTSGDFNTGSNPLALQAGQTTSNGMVGARTVKRSAQFADQVFPFDVTLIAQNEYGHASASGVVGVEIINEGGGISMDDITNEQQMTYIAITRLPWYSLNQGIQKESIYGAVTSITDANQTGTNTWEVNTVGNKSTVQGQ